MAETKLKERVLDTNLLSGSLDVDDYARNLLAQHSIEHATQEIQRLEKEVARLKEENEELKDKMELASKNGLQFTISAATLGGDNKIQESAEKKRKFPAVASLYESRANSMKLLEPLARIKSHASFDAESSRPVDNVGSWYSDVFSDELRVLQNVGQKIADTESALPTQREVELEAEIAGLKRELAEKKHLMDAIAHERDELLETKQAFDAEIEALTTERDQMNDVREAIEDDLRTATHERDEYRRMAEELDLKSRSLQELSKALNVKLASIEESLKVETNRARKAYDFIFRMQQVQAKRRLLQSWLVLSRNTRNQAKADAFRTRKVLSKVLGAWREVTEESATVRGAQVKIQRRLSAYILNAWAREARENAKKKRAALLFSRVKEAQKVRSLFRAWRTVARTMAMASTEGDSDVDLVTLKIAAAKLKVPAIMYAASKGMTEAVLQLINEGAAVNMKDPRNAGRTPLHAASESGSVSVVEILLENRADPSTTDNDGDTPLQRVVKRGPDASVEVALALLRHGSDPAYVAEKDGRSILHLAVDSGVSAQFIAVLLQYKASVKQQQEATGRTALHTAAARGNYDILELLLKNLRDSSKGDWHPDLFPCDNNNLTPLHLACTSESPEMPKCVATLVDFGFNVSAVSHSRETALHMFCKNKSAHPPALSVFPADVDFLDMTDLNGNTPLHFACELNLRGVAVELVTMGASVYIVNDADMCPLDAVPQGFAIQLLDTIRTQPIIAHAKRDLSRLNNCMVCKESLNVGLFGRRVADHCRRCGRLCCAKCSSNKIVLKWPAAPPNRNSLLAAGTSIISSSLETPSAMLGMNESKVCPHCFRIALDQDKSENRLDHV